MTNLKLQVKGKEVPFFLEDIPEFDAYAGAHRVSVVTDWCEDNLPEGSWWYMGFGHYGFDCEQNHLLFTLRWA